MEWEEFIEQHEGLQIIKKHYNFSNHEIYAACWTGVLELCAKKISGEYKGWEEN